MLMRRGLMGRRYQLLRLCGDEQTSGAHSQELTNAHGIWADKWQQLQLPRGPFEAAQPKENLLPVHNY